MPHTHCCHSTPGEEIVRQHRIVVCDMEMKPDDKGKKIKPADVQKIATDKSIPVDNVFQRDNGDVFVNLPDESSRDAIEEHLAEPQS